MIKKFFVFVFSFTLAFTSISQEVLTGLQENAFIINTLKQQTNVNPKSKNNIPLFLPFKDDFSYNGPFPNDSLWHDRFVFCNSTYQLYPPTKGVATFDALNDSGYIYEHASPLSFIADYLTSNPIRLDTFDNGGIPTAVKISDSVYFSFFYQPQGIGDAPELEDNLVLEFFTVTDSTWKQVWSVEGNDLQSFRNQNNSFFKQIMIPITDSALYFNNGFQFRFYNYASIGNNNLPGWAGNVDQWNIDYVYLNVGRSMSDTLYRDITFINNAPTLLKNFQCMPWQQYNAGLSANMIDTMSMLISNLSDITYNYQYLYNVKDAASAVEIHQYDGGSYNLLPFFQNGYQDYAPHAKPNIGFSYPALNDFTDFVITHILNPSAPADISRQNDTSRFIQSFENYYAYDDGSAEAGYGLSVANGKVAYSFTLNKPDTLRGVDIFFNRTLNNANDQYFTLLIWSNLSPETVIYESPLVKPSFVDGVNNFSRYYINDDIIVNGTFYVGFKQTNNTNINIGYDKNTNSNNYLFYNVDNNWYNSMYTGSLMMRPVLGKKIYFAGIKDNISEKNSLSIYPNPVNDGFIHLNYNNINNNDDVLVKIFSIHGKEEASVKFSQRIDVSFLSSGIYIIAVYNKDEVNTKKFVISK